MGWQTEVVPLLIAGNTTIINQSGQLLMYNGTPAANNLLLAESPTDFTDQFGNQGFAGLNIYSPLLIGPQYRMLSIRNSSMAMILYYNTTPAQNSWITGASIAFPGTTTIQLTADGILTQNVTGGIFTTFNVQVVQLSSLASEPTTAFVTSASNIWSNNQGTVCLRNRAGASAAQAGWPGAMPASQVDIETLAAGNNTTLTNITKAWPIPANDAVQGTIYEIETYVEVTMGATATETLTLGVSIDGVNTALATLGATFNGSTVSLSYSIPVRLRLIVDGISISVPFITIDGGIGQTTANRLSTNSAFMPGHTTAASFTKTAAHTVAITVQWGAAGGVGQNAQTRYSECIRKGQ